MLSLPSLPSLSILNIAGATSLVVSSAVLGRIFYNLVLHPLAKFNGPWYARSFSLSLAIVSLRQEEPRWLLSLVKKYGRDKPIRIAPNLLLCPDPSAVNDIYWDPQCNTKAGLYGTGVLGPPNLFTTLSAEEHRALRKALGGPHWSFGALKAVWEPRINDLLRLLTQKMSDFADKREKVVLSDKVAQFAADMMTMITFSSTWGFVANSRDERQILQNWREGLPFFGFAGRFRWFRETVLTSPYALYLLPAPDNEHGIGFLMSQADKEITKREEQIDEGLSMESPDFLQYSLEAKLGSDNLSAVQKRAHVTLLIMAGADTTATALGSTLRFILESPTALAAAQAEIANADAKGLLSTPVLYEETRQHLPYMVACVKEGLRLHPPATNLFARVTPAGGKTLSGGVWVPPGTEITSNAYVVQRDPVLYGPDPEAFRPERWLESKEKASEMEAAMFVFGVGPRVCLGKDIATMELYKVVPEILRQFDMKVLESGEYVVAGGVAYNHGLTVDLKQRKSN